MNSWMLLYVNGQKQHFTPCGSCKMGNDEMAVVDGAGRVHGIESLRVIDASIMPNIITGNLNATTIMIAEKMAEQKLKALNHCQQAKQITMFAGHSPARRN